MTNPNELFDLLKANNPVPDERLLSLPPLEDVLSSRQAAARRPRRRARRMLWIAPILAISTTSVAAAALIAHRHASNPLDIGCYAAADLRADAVVVRADHRNAVSTCAAVWREGALRVGPIPELHECVLPSGAVGVFPGREDVCMTIEAERRATEPSSSTSSLNETSKRDDPDAIVSLRDDLVAVARSAPCTSPTEARQAAEGRLRNHKLKGWTIEVGPGESGAGFTPDRACATFAVDPERRTVILVPTPTPTR